MSFKHTALALDHGPIDTAEKLLLMALCDRADEKGICWPSRSDLVRRTGLSNSTLSRKLRLLEVAGWVQRKPRYNTSVLFRVNFFKLMEAEAKARADGVVKVPHGFEPFQEELDTVQVSENKGDAHCDVGDAHCDTGDAHCDTGDAHPAAPNLPKNLPKNLKTDFEIGFKDLGAFQVSQLRGGNSVNTVKGTIRPGTAHYRKLQAALAAS